jgi:hypothetical protein
MLEWMDQNMYEANLPTACSRNDGNARHRISDSRGARRLGLVFWGKLTHMYTHHVLATLRDVHCEHTYDCKTKTPAPRINP